MAERGISISRGRIVKPVMFDAGEETYIGERHKEDVRSERLCFDASDLVLRADRRWK